MYLYRIRVERMNYMDKEPKQIADMTFLDDRELSKDRLKAVLGRATDVILEVSQGGKKK